MTVNVNMFMWEMHRRSLCEKVKVGLEAMVRAYYENYTDATELESEFIGKLCAVAEDLALSNEGLEVYEAIRDAEENVNDTGGIQSDTDGTWHQVKTQHVWEEVQSWEET